MDRIVYLDNAATSHPKPECVYQAADDFLRNVGASPSRSSHSMGARANRIVCDARERLATLVHAADPSRVVFTLNATEALNLAMKGYLRRGDHVVTSSVEHNSVMRPLRRLETEGIITLSIARCSREGLLDPKEIERHLLPNTRMIVATHASNVTGAIQPIAEIGGIAQRRGVRFLVDAAQTAGVEPLDMPGYGIDLLAFTGHKGLYGTQGVGGLVIGPDVELQPLKEGGTGSNSQHEMQPLHLPDRYESGTQNGPGIAALCAGVGYVLERGVETIRWRLRELTALCLEEIRGTPGAVVYGPEDVEKQTAVVSFTLGDVDTSELGQVLERRYGILTRTGLQCSPAAHRTIGTFRRTRGTVRLSLGCFNTDEEIRYLGRSLREIAKEQRNG